MLLRHQNPGSLVVSDKGLLTGEEATFVADIPEPEVVVFPVVKEKDTGISVIICPGDGYAGLALTTGGYDCAEWMAAQGITGMALKYRLPHGKKISPLMACKRPFVSPTHTAMYYDALKKHGIPASLHIFPQGDHAWGFHGVNKYIPVPFEYMDEMKNLTAKWLKRIV